MSKNPNCLICQGGNIGMNPLALGELRNWHDAGHPTQVSDMLSYSFKPPQQPSDAPKQAGTTPSTELDKEVEGILDRLIVEAVFAHRDSPDPGIIPAFEGQKHALKCLQALIAQERNKAYLDGMLAEAESQYQAKKEQSNE